MASQGRDIQSNCLKLGTISLSLPHRRGCESCCCLISKLCPILLLPHGRQPASLLCPWGFAGKYSSVGCHFLLQGIFTSQGFRPTSPELTGGFFTIEPEEKPISPLKYRKHSIQAKLAVNIHGIKNLQSFFQVLAFFFIYLSLTVSTGNDI